MGIDPYVASFVDPTAALIPYQEAAPPPKLPAIQKTKEGFLCPVRLRSQSTMAVFASDEQATLDVDCTVHMKCFLQVFLYNCLCSA
jgi:hypothetical protein